MTSSDAFELLGLSRKGVTESAVKAAYAALLKKVRPEEDRENFIRLRQAFEIARGEARRLDMRRAHQAEKKSAKPREKSPERIKPPQLPGEAATHADQVEVRMSLPLPDPVVQVAKATEAEEVGPPGEVASVPGRSSPADLAMAQVQALIKEPWQRQSLAAWREILDQESLQSVDDFQEFEEHLRSYVCWTSGWQQLPEPKAEPWMTDGLMRLLDDRFGWTRTSSAAAWAQMQYNWLYSLYSSFEWFASRPSTTAMFSVPEVAYVEDLERPRLIFHPAVVATAVYALFWAGRASDRYGVDDAYLITHVGPWAPTALLFLNAALILALVVPFMWSVALVAGEVMVLAVRGFTTLMRRPKRGVSAFHINDWLALAIVILSIVVIEKAYSPPPSPLEQAPPPVGTVPTK